MVMDSTPAAPPQPQPQPQPQPLSLKASSSARKLPIKRKTPHPPSPSPSSSSSPPPSPNPNPNPNPSLIIPKTESAPDDVDDDDPAGDAKTPPPFKFHRIWTEPDEIRFLQGLLDCCSQALSFPRDLHIFYARFSQTMSQPYSKSQLSEKLRRLRKKFRVISSRLARGLHPAQLSPHDRALFDLSKRLWHPDYSSASPFNTNLSNICGKRSKSTLVGVKVSFSPTLPLNSASASTSHLTTYLSNSKEDNTLNSNDGGDGNGDNGKVDKADGIVKVDVVNLDSPNFSTREEEESGEAGGIGWVAAKAVVDVFDQCLKEVSMVLVRRGILCPDSVSAPGNAIDFENKWRQQRVAELDVFARRLRLVLQNSLRHL